MKPFDSDVIDQLESGNVDYRDAVELVLDSGVVRMIVGVRGQFAWTDDDGVIAPWAHGVPSDELGGIDEPWTDAGYWRSDIPWTGSVPPDPVFYGGGSLVELELPESSIGTESRAVVARVAETYLVEGSDVPVNVFDDDVRATIDEEEWEGRTAILSVFWIGTGGIPIYREQAEIRNLDSMTLNWDAQGVPVRSLVMEEPDISQRDIEGKTSNAAFQALIDPTDRAFEHVGTVQSRRINFGRIEESSSK